MSATTAEKVSKLLATKTPPPSESKMYEYLILKGLEAETKKEKK